MSTLRSFGRWPLFVAALMLFTLLGLRIPSPASARRPSRAEVVRRNRAKAVFYQAQAEYNLKHLKRALVLYTKAYKLLPYPAFLFNIAQCHRSMHQYSKAVHFYKRYLRAGGTNPRRTIVERLIREATLLIRERVRWQREAQRRARPVVPRSSVPPQRFFLRPRDAPPRSREVAGLGGPAVHKRRQPVYKRWWFWTVIAAGVAAVVGTSVGIALATQPDPVLPTGSLRTIDGR